MSTLPAVLPMRWPLIRLLRPRQWIKNTFVLAPLVFAGAFTDVEAIKKALFVFGLFCVASSATYVFNDLIDLDKDRLHPEKRYKRPLAAGIVTKLQARALLGLLYIVLFFGFLISREAAVVILLYLVINIGYSLRLKSIPVVDLFCIATGFVLRVFAGALTLSVYVSSWMLITTLCLALYLAAIKRRQELAVNGLAGRTVLGYYSVPLLDRYAQMAAICAIVFYGLFVAMIRPELVITIPFVLFGLFRYWYIVESLGGGESPTDALWADVILVVTVLAWVGISVYVILAS